jgi:hypothetical protein
MMLAPAAEEDIFGPEQRAYLRYLQEAALPTKSEK